jgi:hypothetical protein
MKALISPIEGGVVKWVSAWEFVEGSLTPIYSDISGTQRVAQVEVEPFEVASPLYWIDCSEDCVADQWYFKDGELHKKPEDAPRPDLADE